MDVFLWLMVSAAIGIISLMMLCMITALTFTFFDITLDWSWMLNIF
tara:strand:- start:304 stop:441 length:138 start_codon:yes stop_codon:yes gene_type:complete